MELLSLIARQRHLLFLLGSLIGFTLTGCGGLGTQPVEGQVNWKDGTPAKELAGSLVFFELAEKQTSAQGLIQPDGSFHLTTLKENDGAMIGEHVVRMLEVGRQPMGGPDGTNLAPSKIDSKYATSSTSDLRATVKRGVNKIILTIDRPGTK